MSIDPKESDNMKHRNIKERMILGRSGRVVAIEACECGKCNNNTESYLSDKWGITI